MRQQSVCLACLHLSGLCTWRCTKTRPSLMRHPDSSCLWCRVCCAVCRAVSSCTACACVRACDTVCDSPTVLLVPNLVLPQQQLLLAGAIPRLAGGGHEILAELPQPIGHHLGQCVQHMCTGLPCHLSIANLLYPGCCRACCRQGLWLWCRSISEWVWCRPDHRQRYVR